MEANDLKWRKSSRSSGGASNCVELALPAGGVAVRDSKNPEGAVLAFGVEVAVAFLAAVKGGRFDG